MLDFIDKPLNPPGPYRFTVISTFAGCGGSSLGYKWAGGTVLAAVEWQANAAATYRLNHQNTSVLERDIATVTAEELLTLTGLQLGELDILDGSPPCQGFSTAGKRVFTDTRNDLFEHYVRLLRGIQPRVFVMENVSGLAKGAMKHKLVEMMRAMRQSGYRVRCQQMNAMYFGVPQSRERLIFIGVRNDVNMEPSHPAPQLQPVGSVRLDGRPAIYSQRRYGDSMERERFPIGTITKIGRSFWSRSEEFGPLSYKVNASFPHAFQFVGTFTDHKNCIGNTVPPRFMQAIAEHIFQAILQPMRQMDRAALPAVTDEDPHGANALCRP